MSQPKNMHDTHPKITRIIHERMSTLPSEARLEMATSMFDCAQEIVIQSLKNQNPNISNEEIKKELLWRFYQFKIE